MFLCFIPSTIYVRFICNIYHIECELKKYFILPAIWEVLSHSISYICVICNCCVEANTILTVPLPTPLSTFHINSVFILNTTRRVPQSICYNLLNKSIFDLIHISGMQHVYAVLNINSLGCCHWDWTVDYIHH